VHACLRRQDSGNRIHINEDADGDDEDAVLAVVSNDSMYCIIIMIR
jgi:hypothetical protein